MEKGRPWLCSQFHVECGPLRLLSDGDSVKVLGGVSSGGKPWDRQFLELDALGPLLQNRARI